MLTVLDIIMHYIHDSYNASPLKAGFMCTFILMPTVLPEHDSLFFLSSMWQNPVTWSKGFSFGTAQRGGTWLHLGLYCFFFLLQLRINATLTTTFWVLHMPRGPFAKQHLSNSRALRSFSKNGAGENWPSSHHHSSFNAPIHPWYQRPDLSWYLLFFAAPRSCRGLCANAEDAARAWQLPASLHRTVVA